MLSASKKSSSINLIDTLVGAKLGEIRSRAGVSQADLAKHLRTTADEVHRWETGHTHIDAPRLIALARALDVPVGAFWAGL